MSDTTRPKSTGDKLSADEINQDLPVQMTAGETINGDTLPVAIYIKDSDGEVYACDADDQDALDFIGFAISNSTDGNDITVQTKGIVSGFTGLDAGKKYYVQDDKTIGTSIGTYEVMVGYAISATQILMIMGDFEYMGSATFSGSGTTSSWSGTLTMPSNARFAIVKCSGSADPCVFKDQIVIARQGATSGFGRNDYSADSSVSWTVSLSTNTITLSVSSNTQNSTWSCSGTAYFYR